MMQTLLKERVLGRSQRMFAQFIQYEKRKQTNKAQCCANLNPTKAAMGLNGTRHYHDVKIKPMAEKKHNTYCSQYFGITYVVSIHQHQYRNHKINPDT